MSPRAALLAGVIGTGLLFGAPYKVAASSACEVSIRAQRSHPAARKTCPEEELSGRRENAAPCTTDLLKRAGELAESWRGEDKRRAIPLWEELRARASEIGDLELRVTAAVRLGDLHRELGRARRALDRYRGALEGALPGDVPLRTEAHLGASRAALRLDDFETALEHARTALELSRRIADESLSIRALSNLGIVHYDSRRLSVALDVLLSAEELWRDKGDPGGAAETLLHLGFTHSDLGEEWRARSAFERTLALARGGGDRKLEALSLMALGHMFSKIGEKQRALDLYHEALPLFEVMEDPYWSSSLYSGMGFVYDELGDLENARLYYSRALGLNEKVISPFGLAGNLIHLGRILAALGEAEKALERYRAALEHVRALGERRMEAAVLGAIGAVHDSRGERVEAVDHYFQALALSREGCFKREEVDILNHLGRIELDRGKLVEARRRFRRALALSRKTEHPFGESRALLNLARVARAAGHLDRALVRAEEALELAERLRTQVSSFRLRSSYFASVYELHQLHVELLLELHERRPAAGFDERAFLAMEQARARSLLEMIARSDAASGSSVDPGLVEYESRLEEQIRARAVAQGRTGRGKASRDAATSSEIDELLAELDRVRAVRRSREDHRKSRVPPRLLPVDELQSELLDSETALLAYFLGDSESHLWVVTSSSLAVHRLPPKKAIEPRVRKIYRLLTARNSSPEETAKQRYDRVRENDRAFWKSATGLSRTLLGEALSDLAVKRLLVVGDGLLNRLPFTALPVPGSDPAEDPAPLVGRYEIVRLPSASVLEVLDTRDPERRTRDKLLAVLADPVFDRDDPRVTGVEVTVPAPESAPRRRSMAELVRSERGGIPRLLSTRREARTILELVPPEARLGALGFEANRALVASGELRRYAVVHFATHGVLNPEHPDLSGIVLSLVDEEGATRDGFLRLHEIYDLDLPVRLVVLSACSTGLGKEIRGEGLIGLVGGFLSAGARGVIASYWDVEDEATAELMRRFYIGVFERKLSPSMALREAQRSMAREKRWRAPFYWAAFEFHGDWN